MRSSENLWALGDRALQAEPVGRAAPRGGVYKRLDGLAEKWGVSAKTLRAYRGMSKAWPKEYRRTDLSWSVHHTMRGQPDKFELIKKRDWTVEELRDFLDDRKRSSNS